MAKRFIALLAILVAGAGLFAGCGDDTKTVTDEIDGKEVTREVPDVAFPKTRFVVNSGIAFGVFKHWVYDPFREGKFDSGADGRTAALVKAAAATAFAYNRVKAARDAALSSDVLRRTIADPLDKLVDAMTGLADKLKSRSFDPGDILGPFSAIAAVRSAAQGEGIEIED